MRAAILLTALAIATPSAAHAARLKELVDVEGFRSNPLVGLGVVVGLAGTGDDANSFLARRPLATIMKNLGSAIDPAEIKARNVAMVMVTAQLPAFGRPGSNLDITVSSIGTAKSLAGGTLIATALKGLDRNTYAIAQGQLVVGGYEVTSLSGSSNKKNHVTVARVPSGAVIERDAPNQVPQGELVLLLKQPDFTTASRIAAAVTAGVGQANVRDPGAVTLKIEQNANVVDLVAKIEALEATPDAPARVVIDERTGTIVVGANVSISPVAIAYGGITIRVRERFTVSQPGPFSRGNTAVLPDSEIDVQERAGRLENLPAASTAGEVAAALNALGVKPRDLLPIFEALKAAGALSAEIKVL